MRVTVAVCTWNRAQSLARTLESVAAARPLRDAELEVVVVNNNCTDETDRVIRQFADCLPLRRVWQPDPGLSNARNAAVATASGDYFVWTDDDVCVDSEWLRAYEEAFRSYPQASFFGGPIEPIFEAGRPAWISEAWGSVSGAFAEREMGVNPFRFDARRLPFGANMAVRGAEQREYRYDSKLGRQPGGQWLAGDETVLMRSLLTQGREGWWIPGCRVRHMIPPERQTVGYLRDYFEGLGRRDAQLERAPAGRRLFGRPAWLWRKYAYREIRYQWLRMVAPAGRWVPALARAAQTKGLLQGLK